MIDLPPNLANLRIVHQVTGKSIEPHPHQWAAIGQVLGAERNRFGMYDTMGAGKSLSAFLVVAYLVAYGNRAICIMPPKLMPQFQKNFHAMFEGFDFTSGLLYKGKKQSPSAYEANPPDVLITSPDFFLRHKEWLSDHKYDVMVQDEAKWLSNPETNMWKATHWYVTRDKRALVIMTGTPARNDLINLYGFIKLTSPNLYYDIAQFKRLHINYESFNVKARNKAGREVTRRVNKISGYKDVERIYEALYQNGRRIEMPPPTGVELLYKEVSLDDAHHAAYTKLVQEKLVIFDDNTVLDASQAGAIRHAAMRAIFNPDTLKISGEGVVLETVREMLEELEGKKVLLCAYYRETVERLAKEFDGVCIYGGVSASQAEQNKERFLTDPNCRVMVINYESGGVGLDGLQAVCHDAIAVEPTSVPGDFDQTVARLARQGQENGVRFWSIIVHSTLYRSIVRDRLSKKANIAKVVRATAGDLRKELLGEQHESLLLAEEPAKSF